MCRWAPARWLNGIGLELHGRGIHPAGMAVRFRGNV